MARAVLRSSCFRLRADVAGMVRAVTDLVGRAEGLHAVPAVLVRIRMR
jgi:hypothetical protein